jgi:putative IMPACT (imprinted ancient) family translation regulator
MQRPTAPCSFRFREKASVFLTELHPAAGPDQRAAILAALRKRDHDANHHCSAWREGPAGGGGHGSDDDGEPSGTAGAPMLRVLEGEDLVDILAVCIRWFGGTRLGTGGLVRAYTEGVQGAVREARERGLLEQVRAWRQGVLQAPPERAHLPFAALGAVPEAEVLAQEFGAQGALVRFRVPPERAAAVEEAWRDRSRGGQVLWD